MNSWPLKMRDKFMSFDSWYSCSLYTDTIRQKFFFFSSKKSGALINIPSTVLDFRMILEERSGSAPMKRSICSMVILKVFRCMEQNKKKRVGKKHLQVTIYLGKSHFIFRWIKTRKPN